MTNHQALADFTAARNLYLARRFTAARTQICSYRQHIDYRQFEQQDRRSHHFPHTSVIIVSFGTGLALLECLNSVFSQRSKEFEVILVDNGGNETVSSQLVNYPLLWIRPPINLLPSEGRNVGAFFARGKWLIFLDDDAVMAPGYVEEADRVMTEHDYLALRGRIVPKEAQTATSPPHYDLGNRPLPAPLSLEGNMAIRHQAFTAVGGFDPLLFGHEGKELSQRCQAMFPQQPIYYWPTLVIQHEFPSEQRLAAKKERQVLANEYIQALEEQTVNKRGVSILIRAGNCHEAAERFLASVVKFNTHKPVEAVLMAEEPKHMLNLIRPYLPRIFVRVLAADALPLSQKMEKLRFDLVLVVDLPAVFEADLLPSWVQGMQENHATMSKVEDDVLPSAILCKKADLALAEVSENITMTRLAVDVSNTISPASVAVAATNVPKASSKRKSKTPPGNKVEKHDLLDSKILKMQANIQTLEEQLTQTDQDIVALEQTYLAFEQDNAEKQNLKDRLEEMALASCSLLMKLKDAHDSLQELRVRRFGTA